MVDIISSRLINQHLAQPRHKTPVDVVRWFGAVQSQDLVASLWAVGLRLEDAVTQAEVEQAIADKTLVRTWPMRGTIHLVPAEDAHWMLRLLAPRLDAKVAGNYRRAGLTPETVAKAGEVLKKTMSGKQCIRAELYNALNAAGIATNGQNGEQRGMHLLVHWARHGLLCVTPRRGKQQTFALLDEWIPVGRQLTGDEALAELAIRYFRSHGPATIKDFAWWTGLTMTEAKRAVAFTTLHTEAVEGVEYLFNTTATHATHRTFLLPPYDEYTVAYANRTAIVDPQHFAAVKNGIAPNIIIDGRIAGTWKRTIKKDMLVLNLELLAPLTDSQKTLVQQAAQRYATFLGFSQLNVHEGLLNAG